MLWCAALCCAVLLPGLVMAKLGGAVTATDLAGNLPLLQHNCTANGVCVPVALTHIHTRSACLPEIVTGLVVVCPLFCQAYSSTVVNSPQRVIPTHTHT